MTPVLQTKSGWFCFIFSIWGPLELPKLEYYRDILNCRSLIGCLNTNLHVLMIIWCSKEKVPQLKETGKNMGNNQTCKMVLVS